MGQHALLSPSGAHRWMNCPISAQLEARFPQESSEFADEGTLAHAICARKLKEWLGLPTAAEVEEIAGLKEHYDPEMEDFTDIYVQIVRDHAKDGRLLVEQFLDLTRYVPDGFGTSDAVVLSDDELCVIDFKYGKGVRVDAENNPQMMLYALGAYIEHHLMYDFKKVSMVIVQPRLYHISKWSMTTAELLEWADKALKPAVAEAKSYEARQCPGEWCRFCRAKAMCRELADQAREVTQKWSDPALLSVEEMGQAYAIAELLQPWIKKITDTVTAMAMDGTKIDGYKLVKGRGKRVIAEPEKLRRWLEDNGFDKEKYMAPQTLASMTALEKMVGKKRFADECGTFLTKTEGLPKLVKDTEQGEEYNNNDILTF